MIIVTGGAGFIGSNIVKSLNEANITNIIIVDDLDYTEKWKNLRDLKFLKYINYRDFLGEMQGMDNIDIIIHMGACSNTMERDTRYLMDNNFNYSTKIYDFCAKKGIRLIYASSAAVYGDGMKGYNDIHTDRYIPLNMYGYTKKLFDQYVLRMTKQGIYPVQCVGLRFFNVYGPNEAHKDNMASVMLHAYNQIKETGKVKLFKSYKDYVKDGEQERDFIYVKDVCDVIMHLTTHENINGIFNLGTGKARTYNDVAQAVGKAMGVEIEIEYIDMPEHLKDKYQYYTEADMKLFSLMGYKESFWELEEGVKDYVQNYLMKE